jgi:hypothetical protein
LATRSKRGTISLSGIILKVKVFNASSVIGGSKEVRLIIALGPDTATAETPVCAPVMIDKPES